MATLELKLDVSRQQLRKQLALKHLLKNNQMPATPLAHSNPIKSLNKQLINDNFYAIKLTLSPVGSSSQSPANTALLQQKFSNAPKSVLRSPNLPDINVRPRNKSETTCTAHNTELFKRRLMIQKQTQIMVNNRLHHDNTVQDIDIVIRLKHALKHRHDLEETAQLEQSSLALKS